MFSQEKYSEGFQMEKYIQYSAFLFFCISWSLFAMDTPNMAIGSDGEVDVATYRQLVGLELAKRRVLFCFFNESERKDSDPVRDSVLSALYQGTGPILLSTSILQHIVEIGKSDDRSTENIKKIILSDDGPRPKDENILHHRSFKPEQWIIKKVNHALSIMISKKQLKFFNIDWNKANEYIDADIASDIELQLGLRVNHLKTIGIEDIVQHGVKDKGAGCSADEIKVLFCKKQDYVSRNMIIPEWYIFMNGHGSLTLRVAGMPLSNFQSLLGFFSSYINTQLLFVNSCYAMGVNAKKIYEETSFGLQKQYPFPIIALGFNDTFTTGKSLRSGLSDPEKIENIVDWDSILQLLGKLNIDYGKITKIFSSVGLENTSQIKLSAMEWFSVMDVDKKTVAIGSIFAQTKNPKKSLNIKTYFKKDPAAILLRTDDIPFELDLTSLSRLEDIISMVSSGPMIENPDFVVHRIKKMSLPAKLVEKSVLDWLRLFESAGAAKGSKMFFIDEFGDKKNLILFGLSTPPDAPKVLKAYFKDNDDNCFVAKFKLQYKHEKIVADKIIKSSPDEQDYLEKIKIATVDYPQAKAVSGIKRVTPESIKKIEDVYSEQHISPGPRGRRMYEELRQ
jgi:hypothetical protein